MVYTRACTPQLDEPAMPALPRSTNRSHQRCRRIATCLGSCRRWYVNHIPRCNKHCVVFSPFLALQCVIRHPIASPQGTPWPYSHVYCTWLYLCTLPAGQQWVHHTCALWIPETYFDEQGRVCNLHGVDKRRFRMKCIVCERKRTGACIQCSFRSCTTPYHVPCARKAGFDMIIRSDQGCSGTALKTCCAQHSQSRATHASSVPAQPGSTSPSHSTPSRGAGRAGRTGRKSGGSGGISGVNEEASSASKRVKRPKQAKRKRSASSRRRSGEDAFVSSALASHADDDKHRRGQCADNSLISGSLAGSTQGYSGVRKVLLIAGTPAITDRMTECVDRLGFEVVHALPRDGLHALGTGASNSASGAGAGSDGAIGQICIVEQQLLESGSVAMEQYPELALARAAGCEFVHSGWIEASTTKGSPLPWRHFSCSTVFPSRRRKVSFRKHVFIPLLAPSSSWTKAKMFALCSLLGVSHCSWDDFILAVSPVRQGPGTGGGGRRARRGRGGVPQLTRQTPVVCVYDNDSSGTQTVCENACTQNQEEYSEPYSCRLVWFSRRCEHY